MWLVPVFQGCFELIICWIINIQVNEVDPVGVFSC